MHVRWIRIVHVLIILSLIAPVPALNVHAATSTLTNDTIKKSEESKKQAEAQKNQLKSNLTDVKSLLNSLEASKANLAEYIKELDSDLEDINAKIDELTKLIAEKEVEIEITKKELGEAIVTSDKQYETMKKRVKYMYEKGNNSYVQILFSSKSFTDFLNRAEFVSKLSAYDKRMLDNYIATQESIADKEATLEQEEEVLEEAKAAVINEQNAMESLIADKEEEIIGYENDIQDKEAAIAEYEAMIAEQNQIIKDLEAAIAAEKKRLEEENRKAISYDGGKFKWPAPSYVRISDEYGNRIHPILKTQQFHNGLDMAAPSGSPILAAYDGEVIASAYSSTMGNYAMIDHGDGLITIYMHASSMSVGKGQTVTKGQQIGCVGSTGRSTGAHLHFSVRLNGEYVSPWNYLSK